MEIPINQNMLHKAINKNGWNNFKVILLEKNIDESLLNEKEKYWIIDDLRLWCKENINYNTFIYYKNKHKNYKGFCLESMGN